MKCKWLFEESMLRTSYHERMDDVCKELGIPYQVVKYVPIASSFGEAPFDEAPTFDKGDCVVTYASIEAVNGVKYYDKNYIPSGYIQEKELACKKYMPQIPSEDLLNSDYIMLPYGEFLKRREKVYDLFNTNKLFIRPDSGLKTFAGTTIHLEDFDYEINTLEKLTSVEKDTIVVIAPIQPIEKEYRVVIGNRDVIASSLYKIKGNVIMKEGAPEEVIELAKKIGQIEWQPDLVYTCDIATLTDGSAKVIELNSFSCAGLYACNLRDIVTKVSEIALKEYNGELYLGDN